MPVSSTDIENALHIAIEDEALSDEDIRKDELTNIQKRFNNLLDLLKQQANEEPRDDG